MDADWEGLVLGTVYTYGVCPGSWASGLAIRYPLGGSVVLSAGDNIDRRSRVTLLRLLTCAGTL
jgi:hypothetical protein